MRLGAHMSISGGKDKALDRGNKIGCESIQIFTGNVRRWASKPLDEKEIKLFKEKREKYNIFPILSHNSYLVNLANTDEEKLQKSYNAMLDELTRADQLGLEYVNMHPGNKNEGEKEIDALLRIAEQINLLLNETKNSDVLILLETTAGQGNDVGYKFEHMIAIMDKIENKKRIGVTFDTQHSFAAGYDFRNKKLYEKLWNEFDDIIGLKYLYACHLNDSKSDLGNKVDRHDHIGQGKIGKEPFGFFINDERFKEVPGILETPNSEKTFEDNLNVLKSLRKK
jgi:deoxyribonuclease-4